MSRRRIGALALRAYPRELRAARGEEMLGTLLDAGEDSSWAFIAGAASLLLGGVRARARDNAGVGARRLVADGFCLAAVLWSLYELRAMTHEYEMAAPWTIVLMAVVPLLAALGRDRVAGLCGLIVAAHVLIGGSTAVNVGPGPQLLGHQDLVFFVDRWLGAGVCFLVMLLAPRRRARRARGLLWLVPAAAFLLVPALPASVLLLIAVPLAGIVLLPVDPRLAIASAVLWADLVAASTLGHLRLGLVTLPIVLFAVLLTVARGRALGRQTPV